MSASEPRVFFPQRRINEWASAGLVDISETRLSLIHAAREYTIEEAVLVQAEVTTGVCPHDMLGRVFTRSELHARNAEVMEDSMILGEHAYDLISGWVGRPTTDFVTHIDAHPVPAAGVNAAGVNGASAAAAIASEEALLAHFLGHA